MKQEKIHLGKGWGVLHVDPQVDFMEGGALAVTGGHDVIRPINRLTAIARRKRIPVAMSADWHPTQTTHFKEFGGPWPVHCVAKTEGAAFGPGIDTKGVTEFHKGQSTKDDGYSPWEGVSKTTRESLESYFSRQGVNKLLIDGLATDYCVRAAVMDALGVGENKLRRKFDVYVVEDAIAAVNVKDGDGQKAIDEMKRAGAHFIPSRRIARFF